MFTFYVIAPHWRYIDSWNSSACKTRTYQIHLNNIMVDDVLDNNNHYIYYVEPHLFCPRTLRVNKDIVRTLAISNTVNITSLSWYIKWRTSTENVHSFLHFLDHMCDSVWYLCIWIDVYLRVYYWYITFNLKCLGMRQFPRQVIMMLNESHCLP